MGKKIARILYLCNGKQCPGVMCAGEGQTHCYADNRILYSECKHTVRVKYAKNGQIKGPIDFIRRFKIHFRPWIYFVERDNKLWRR